MYEITILEVILPKDDKIMSKSIKALLKPMKKLASSTTVHIKVDKADEYNVGDKFKFEREEFELNSVVNDNGTFITFKVI